MLLMDLVLWLDPASVLSLFSSSLSLCPSLSFLPGYVNLNAMQCSVDATERNRWYSVLKVNSKGLETFVLTSPFNLRLCFGVVLCLRVCIFCLWFKVQPCLRDRVHKSSVCKVPAGLVPIDVAFPLLYSKCI